MCYWLKRFSRISWPKMIKFVSTQTRRYGESGKVIYAGSIFQRDPLKSLSLITVETLWGVSRDKDFTEDWTEEIKPVNPKGNQSWIIIGRINAEAEAPVLWPPEGEEMTHLKRPWCWERLKVGGEGDDRGCSGWMASPIRWTWVWINSGSWWWTGRPGMLQSVGSQRVGHDWEIELNWWWYNRTTELSPIGFSQSVNQLWTSSSRGMSPHRLQSKCYLLSSPSHGRIHFSPKMS